MGIFHHIFISIAALYVLWIFFLAWMSLERAKAADLLSPTARKLGLPIGLVGYALDFFCNVTIMTVLFIELPREFTVTERLSRLIYVGSGWRCRLASWFIPILDPFDPSGRHVTRAPQGPL